jgi:ketosteroid isomerase-like protein
MDADDGSVEWDKYTAAGHGSRPRWSIAFGMTDDAPVLAAERRFFDALLAADVAVLDQTLAADFMLIDVMTGGETLKPALLAVIGSGQLRFDAVEVVESRVRWYGDSAVVTGQTRMTGRFGETPFTTRSRYTHVYVRQEGTWRLAAAQGTQITAE